MTDDTTGDGTTEDDTMADMFVRATDNGRTRPTTIMDLEDDRVV